MTKFSDIRYINGYESWEDMLLRNKRSTLVTMARNLTSDLEAGYEYNGLSIQRQLNDMHMYAANIEEIKRELSRMDADKRERHCFKLLKASGAIE